MRIPCPLLIALAVALPPTTAAAQTPRFPPGSVWHQDISAAPLHPDSATLIATLDGLGGWGPVSGVSHRMHIDFSFHLRRVGADELVPRYPVVAHKVYEDYYSPDCEAPGTLMPVPADAAFEGEDGLACDNANADCHLLVVEKGLLYELYSGDFDGTELDGLCLAVWDLSADYPPEGRGEHCTSADAAGFPIAALLPNADAVAAAAGQPDSDLGHAIRFILPNARMASDASLGGVGGRLYVRPASHAGAPAGPVASVPYGARLRLRSDFPTAGYNAAAQVILRTMQRYGIVLADGGNIALTFESDRHAAASWFGSEGSLGITPQVFWNGSDGDRRPLRVTDFAVIDTGPRIAETFDCVRSVVPSGSRVFHDGFEGG